MDMSEIKSLIEDQGNAFEAFKTTLEEEVKGKLGKDDPLVTEKLSKIEKSLDDAIEAKTALESAIEAERKEREALEMRINKAGIQANSEEEAKTALAVKDFNLMLADLNHERKSSFEPLDADGYSEYKAALDTFMRKGKDVLTAEEVKTMSVGVDADGGYLVTPDMTGRMATKVFETSPIRQIASVQSIGTDALEGIEDLGEAGFGWVGETETRSDTTTPQVGKWKIEAFEMYAQPKATQKLLDDASVNVEAWLAGKVSDRFARGQNAAFVTGSGVGRPRGFTSYTTAADDGSGVDWGNIGHVVSGANGGFHATGKTAIDALFDLVGAVKDAYLPASRWVTRRSVVTGMRKLKDDQGQLYWQPSLIQGEPERFMGYPITRAEDMPALAAGSLSLGFGDFATAYQIVDRIGVRVLRDPFTDKPYVKFYTTARVGGGVINFESIKLMKFSAS